MRNQSELYANQIINALVNHRASILVGSGFSRNAISINYSNKVMPLWNDLIDEFYKRLDLHENQKYMDPLAIAQSMNDMYDRPTLDSLIYELMHEDDFIPGDAHKNLLKLPWKTVYTTNYDTLLERAAKQIMEPKYVFVNNVDDLLKNNDHPRIIKLHGSFPSSGPYIITEEDFRKYPTDYAPFVNTVQQSLLENTFCLIGFSGTDPNFLKWIGWIHDSLGIDKSPLIYMITDKPKSQAETKSFYAKKIGLIVLDDFDFLRKYGNDLKKKYETFIKYLHDKVKKKADEKDVWIDEESLNFFQSDEEFDEEELSCKLDKLHNTYLGWIFIPHTERDSVYNIIVECSRYFDSDKPKEFGIAISYEYCWLHDISGIPYGQYYVNRILKIIDNLSAEQKETYRDRIQYIRISLLKYYRLKGTDEEFKKLINQIDQDQLNSEMRNSLIYEQIWQAINHLDFKTAFSMIEDIEIYGMLPIWSLKKGFLLVLAGKAEKANRLIINTYEKCIKIIISNRFDHNYYYLSLINCMYLFSKMLAGFNGVISYNDFNKIYESYKNIQINEEDFTWDDEATKYVNSVKKTYEDVIKKRNNLVLKYDFDHIYTQYDFTINNSSSLVDVICSYFYFREATGIPFIFKKNCTQTDINYVAKGLSLYDLKKAIALSIITNNDDIIDNAFTREIMAGFSVEMADELFNDGYQLFIEACEVLSQFNNSVYNYIFKVIPQLLSRLIVKCSDKYYDKCFNIIEMIYENRALNIDMHKVISRMIQNMPLQKIEEHMSLFWKDEFNIGKDDSFYPDCLSFIIPKQLDGIYFAKHDSFDQDIEKLFERIKIKKETQKDSKFDCYRLGYAAILYEFNEKQKQQFSQLICAEDRIDRSFFKRYFPILAYRNIKNVKEFVNRDLQELMDVTKNHEDELTLLSENAIREIGYIFDSCHELVEEHSINILIDRLDEFCEHQLQLIDSKRIHYPLYDAAIETFKYIGRLLGSAILKYKDIYNCKQEKIIQIRDIINQANSANSLLNFIFDKDDNRVDKLCRELVAVNETRSIDAIRAFVILIENKKLDENNTKKLIEPLLGFLDIRVRNYIIALDQLLNYGVEIQDIKQLDDALLQIAKVSVISSTNNQNQTNAYDKMYIREAACALAYDMNKKYPFESLTGVQEWERIATKDSSEFVNVRNVWNDREYLNQRKHVAEYNE